MVNNNLSFLNSYNDGGSQFKQGTDDESYIS